MDIAGTPTPEATPPMRLQVTLVDLSPRMVNAWKQSFEANPEVMVVQGSMLDQRLDAWTTPTNTHVRMDGGLDAAIAGHLDGIETEAQRTVRDRFGGKLPVGCAAVTPTGHDVPRYLISTPTMHGNNEDVSATMNVALACVAALQAVRQHNRERGQQDIYTIALPGLGAGTGQVPPEIAADLMWTAYDLMKGRDFADFSAARTALAHELGEPDVIPKTAAIAKASSQLTVAPAASSDEDFDDFD
jgi:O-acetyl-ADP-ribose deacetylase (regulator of RNase III)